MRFFRVEFQLEGFRLNAKPSHQLLDDTLHNPLALVAMDWNWLGPYPRFMALRVCGLTVQLKGLV